MRQTVQQVRRPHPSETRSFAQISYSHLFTATRATGEPFLSRVLQGFAELLRFALAIISLALLIIASRGYQAPRSARENSAKGVFKAAASFIRWARKHGPQTPATIGLRHEPGMPKAQFLRKANTLKRLGEEDNLFKAINPVRPRDRNRRIAHQQDLIHRIHEQYGQRNPGLSRRLINRITDGGMQLDHVNELQTAGADLRNNMRYLDSFTNREIGTQIREQIKNLPDGTPIRIRIII